MKAGFVILVALLFARSAGAQVCLHGTVQDDTLRAPVVNAAIFFTELNVGTTSDENGRFTICNLQKGNFTIQVKRPGYKSYVEFIQLKDSLQELEIRLSLSAIDYPEVIVYGTRSSKSEETPDNITPLTSVSMRESGALSLSDGIAKLPGVSQLTTGAGISKPVIRGLFGNRIQTNLMGMRFDNQQWQDEHGLGLSDIGVDRIEIIKGPSSLLYGSEAMGGVLNIIEEKPAPVGKTVGDFSTRFFSNTLGVATDAGVKGTGEKFNWRFRAGMESHADYTDGNDKRIVNSRFDDYTFKTSLGYTGKKWISVNDYLFSLSNFGFLMDAFGTAIVADARNSRDFTNPHHTVYVNLFSSRNTFFLKKSKLQLNFGTHINNRQEQEGGNKISLNMLLSTYSANLTWIKDLSDKTEFSAGTQDMFQTNKNLGSRMIVPDATIFESSVFAYLKHRRNYFFTEGGIRYDVRNIQTFTTGIINNQSANPGTDVVPFNKMYNALNGSFGISLYDKKHWNFKTNVSSGYRSGNLAELSSNGLHEGTVRYEIGDINLKIEQNLCSDIYLAYDSKSFTISGSAYINHFWNYIYLEPTNTQFIGFQIFRYIQKDATLKGTEATIEFHPAKFSWLVVKSSYAGIIGKTDGGDYLPFIPAQKISSEVKFLMKKMGKFSSSFLKLGDDYVFPQNTPDQFETPTIDYMLVNAGIGTHIENKKYPMEVSVSGNNLLNKVYYDHLSRFKYFGIYNMGRNISLNFKINF